jgi:vancomycin resistance protein YoaR
MINTKENKKSNNREGNKNKKRIIIIAEMFLGAVAISFCCYFYVYYEVKSFESIIYPNVFINGLELSKFTEDQATNALNENYLDEIKKSVINIKSSDKNYILSFSELNPKYNINEVVEEAYNYKKNESLINKYIQITDLFKENTDYNIDLKYEYDDAAILKIASEIEKDISKEPVDASIKIEDGNVVVTDDIKGVSLKKDELIAKLKEIASNVKLEDNNIDVPLDVVTAKVTGDFLREINGIISSFTTSDSSYVRLVNMGVAAKDLNGTLIFPGETFSFNDVVGDSLPEKGYVLSHSFINGRSVEDYGGGVCQVSTTLYGALMRANISPIERGHHMMPIWYVPKGLDAAVFYGVLDLKFKNEFNAPIYIYANLTGENLTITLYGNTNLMNGLTYKPYSVQVSSWAPSEINYVKDLSKPKDYIKVEQSPTNGYKMDVYLQTLDGSGNVIKDEYIYSDIYDANPGYIIKGTK